jgi:parallel beta-helix repeat protein
MSYPQNFVSQSEPPISAAWLNALDTLANAPTALNGAQTVAQILAALGITPDTQEQIGQLLWPQTAAETAASVTPTNYFYPPGNINRYGTNTTPGTTDMSVALASALAVGLDVYIPAGTYYLASAGSFVLQSNQTIHGDGKDSLLIFANNNGNNLQGSGVSGVTISNLRLQVLGTGTQNTSYIGVIALLANSADCIVEGCNISGYSMCGVLLQDAISCTTRKNYFNTAVLNVVAGDGAAVYLRGTAGGCQYNEVTENQIFSNSYEGIAVLTGSGVAANTGLNQNNLIAGNRVGTQQGYGILVYSGNGAYDLFNQVIGNYIENIQGASTVAGGSSGAGIYCVGAGGLVLANNTIRNCCVATSNESLAPGGIGISGVGATATPLVVTGNSVSGMTQYHGIDVVSCAGSVAVVGNTVLHPSSNTTGVPIKVNGSSLSSVRSNTIVNSSTQQAIWVHIVNAVLTQVDIVANQIKSAGPGIVFDVGSGSLTQAVVADNNVNSSAAESGLVLAGILQGVVKGNNLNVGAAIGLVVAACVQMRFSANNVICTSSSYGFQSSGVCTDSYVDESNYFNANGTTGAGAINNTATGMIVRIGTAPTTGFGTPSGAGVIANFPGASATLPQCSEVIAEVLTIMKANGWVAT